jgi:UDP-3-O-[3-hydroxymyristoyl] glucosamine N-acyltransferase
MPDQRFFKAQGPFSLSELASIANAQIGGAERVGAHFTDVAPLNKAGAENIGFLDNPLYLDEFAVSTAGACVVHPDRATVAPEAMALLLTEQPYLSYALIAGAFYDDASYADGFRDEVRIDPDATIGEGCEIAPGVVIGANASIGSGCNIGPNSVIGPGVVIGENCRIGAGVSIFFCLMGDRVRIYSGARIGEAGFGFAPGPSGFITVPQIGRVIIGDDVEVGANSTVDRGSGPDTEIGAGSRIDNLVQIGHNVKIGDRCIIVAQTGISGSTKLEDFVVLGGQVGTVGHISIGKGAQIAAQSGVMRDVPPGVRYMGSPAIPLREYMRQVATMRKLSQKKAKPDG